jgi:hypothetical protein
VDLKIGSIVGLRRIKRMAGIMRSALVMETGTILDFTSPQ